MRRRLQSWKPRNQSGLDPRLVNCGMKLKGFGQHLRPVQSPEHDPSGPSAPLARKPAAKNLKK